VKLFELLLFSGPVSEAPGDTLVALIPEDERPMRGDLGLVDWRLCGALSQQLISGFVTGALDEVALLPVHGPFAARRVLTLGIGPSDKVAGRALRRATASAVERLLSLGSPLAVLALPGAVDLDYDGPLLLQAAVQALSRLRGDCELRLVVPDARRRARSLASAINAVQADAEMRRVELSIRGIEATPEVLRAEDEGRRAEDEVLRAEDQTSLHAEEAPQASIQPTA